MAAGIAGLNEDRPLESASLGRVGSSRRGMTSGLAVGIDMVEAHEICVRSLWDLGQIEALIHNLEVLPPLK